MASRPLFSAADLQTIKEATAAAEARTGGEIVPYVVHRIVDRDEERWRGATIGSLGAALAAGLLHGFGGFWGGSGVWWITLPAIVGAGLGYLISGFPAVGRFLIPQDQLERAAQLRAEAAFLEESVFETRDRTGVLVFLALFEHRAVILADEGIHRAVPKREWQSLVDLLVSGIRCGRAVEAMCDVIGRCGGLLERYEVTRRSDDVDELADAPRIRER
jgi:putative membrane protein